jgi:catechol 2,3-dioxygenase-like lactoylglutathione lyase family enzyme
MSENGARWTAGAHHVGLTVPDLSAAVDFFEDGLGFEAVGEVPDYPAAFLSDGAVMITLWQAENGAEATPFDRRHNLGLHHLAITVRPGALDDLHKRLESRGDVRIEFAPESLGGGPTRHMMTRIPGDIRVEFIAPAQP